MCERVVVLLDPPLVGCWGSPHWGLSHWTAGEVCWSKKKKVRGRERRKEEGRERGGEGGRKMEGKGEKEEREIRGERGREG